MADHGELPRVFGRNAPRPPAGFGRSIAPPIDSGPGSKSGGLLVRDAGWAGRIVLMVSTVITSSDATVDSGSIPRRGAGWGVNGSFGRRVGCVPELRFQLDWTGSLTSLSRRAVESSYIHRLDAMLRRFEFRFAAHPPVKGSDLM